MKALIIGGERHGEWRDGLPDGIRMWVDIEHACRHVVRKLTWTITSPAGQVLEAYVIYVAVHEQIQGPEEQAVVHQLLQILTFNAFAREHGEAQEIKHEPSAAERLLEEKS